MALEQIDQLGPREFLDHVLQTPYSEEDRIEEIGDRIAGVAFTIFESIAAPFVRPFITLYNVYYYFLSDPQDIQNERELKREWVEKLANEQKVDTRMLQNVITITENLAKKMGLGEIKILWSKSGHDSAEAGQLFSGRVIRIGLFLAALSDEEIQWIIAHELAHVQHQHSKKFLFLCLLSLGIQLLVFRFWNFRQALGLVMVFYQIWGEVERRIAVYLEKDADEKAMQVLNSSIGMIKRFHRQLQQNYKIKHLSKEEARKRYSQEDLKKLENLQLGISLQGNKRDDVSHPPLTERLSHALSFRPVPA